jgi:TPR repeat protein
MSKVALADMVMDGHGCKISYSKANRLYKKAYENKKLVEAGIWYAITCLYIPGKAKAGVELLKTLYDVNNYEINEFLGWCYEYNIGVDRDADKSKKYLKAAELIKEVIKD